jgi:putative flavoprotein involved in K+ transport
VRTWVRVANRDRSSSSLPGILTAPGVTEVPGLYFLGVSWQHTRGSALFGFVNDDAFLAEQSSSPTR